jgi:hypothetical protein
MLTFTETSAPAPPGIVVAATKAASIPMSRYARHLPW